MRYTHYIYIISALAVLTACSDDIATTSTYTVGEGDNAIVLSAGIGETGSAVQTRAAGSTAIETSGHTSHLPFADGTRAALRIDGDWRQSDGSISTVQLSTTATIGAKTGDDDKHNTLSLSPVIYWDDYGTADPANMSGTGNGRAKGLTIYGAAVNGVTSAPTIDGTTGKKWTEREWSVGIPGGETESINQTTGWNSHDLLTTNNVRTGGPDDTYKFDEKSDGKLLEFTHAMTKVTVNLTAGDGFADDKFVDQPSVTLLNFNYTGNVNIETKTSTPTASKTTNIQARFANYKETGTESNWTAATSTWTTSNKAQFDALVFPCNQFADATDILKIEADGNTYYVNATKINAAMNTAGDTDKAFKQAKNFIFNITVNKTGIDVTATIKDWENVEAANETPIIGFSKCYGQEGTDFAKSFTFYRSTAVDGSFTSGITEGNKSNVSYNAGTGYSMTPQLYWPNHSTHYFFRGIWPLVGDDGTPTDKVKTKAIEVDNCAYTTGTYPSDLMIGMPRTAEGGSDETCKAGHKLGDGTTDMPGICATDATAGSSHANEGLIHMNFQYAMSQVIVELTTSTGGDAVTFDEHTKVEIIGGYTQGSIKLGNQASDFSGMTVTDYLMNRKAETDHKNYHDAIIPQSLQDGEGNATLKFRITVGDGTKNDVYETVLGIKNIKVTEGSIEKDITSWEPGKKYTYTLYITKTNINVTATLTDWTTVTASQPIWF